MTEEASHCIVRETGHSEGKSAATVSDLTGDEGGLRRIVGTSRAQRTPVPFDGPTESGTSCEPVINGDVHDHPEEARTLPNDGVELPVNLLGEYIRRHMCDRRVKLGWNQRETAKDLPFTSRLFNPLDPVLQEKGEIYENRWESSLDEEGLSELSGGTDEIEWDEFAELVADLNPGETAYGRQVSVEGGIGDFTVTGVIDFVLVLWEDGYPCLRLVETKASRRDRTYHRIQVACYMLLVQSLLEDQPINVEPDVAVTCNDLECVVGRIDESTQQLQDVLDLEPLALELEIPEVRELLAGDGPVSRAVSRDIDDLDYHLGPKCDGCVMDVHCFPESAREDRLELLGIEPSTARALRAEQVGDVHDLADVDLNSDAAARLEARLDFTASLRELKRKAKARRQTLPGGTAPDEWELMSYRANSISQLPEHLWAGQPLTRIYLSVEYDYVEDRVGAIAAHVTASDGEIETTWREEGPEPEVRERVPTGLDEDGNQTYDHREVRGQDVIQLKASEWTGDPAQDRVAERDLLQGFFSQLVGAIANVAGTDQAPVHFYVWDRTEVTRLMEACSRAGSNLLSHLRHLMGFREPTEQLIFSCLREEVDNRFALGWTSRGLVVATSLWWFGDKYHWVRDIAGARKDLERVFTQDLFDFKTDLYLQGDGTWDPEESEGDGERHKFEIRSRFYDSLPAPYWRAYWRTLPDPDTVDDPQTTAAIHRYNQARNPPLLREYERARVHALRWVEERIDRKNDDIEKPPIELGELPEIELGVEDLAEASVDFLRLDHHMKVSQWLASHIRAPRERVPKGQTIPVTNVFAHQDERITADIDLGGYELEAADLRDRTAITEGEWVRLSPHSGDPDHGQTISQLTSFYTCEIADIDWENERLMLEHRFTGGPGRYRLQSGAPPNDAAPFQYGTVDDSVSDLVAPRVDEKLCDGRGQHVYRWFDHHDPDIPAIVPLEDPDIYREFLDGYELPDGNSLKPSQANACLEGLEARVQLMLGPPGTGKTLTAGCALLLRVLARRSDGDIVFISGPTHTAVNGLLRELADQLENFTARVEDQDLEWPGMEIFKLHSSTVRDPVDKAHVRDEICGGNVRRWDGERQESVLVIGGTINSLLKEASNLNDSVTFGAAPDGFQVDSLVVDEAGMMKLPSFLSLASLVRPEGDILLAGDDKQLAPIVAHNWEEEERPPIVHYQPYASAFEAVHVIWRDADLPGEALVRSPLEFSFRLPSEVRSLIRPIYEDVEIEGRETQPEPGTGGDPLEQLWLGETGLFLVEHDERGSVQSNPLEAQLVRRIIEAAPELGEGDVAVMTPHRAQRTLLRRELDELLDGPVRVVDTVERMQGGEAPVVIVSGTVSDPTAISSREQFYLDLNRSNVAFSRAQSRLVVVCSNSLLGHVPPEVDEYEASALWKSIRVICSSELGEVGMNGNRVQFLGLDLDMISEVLAEEEETP